MTNPTNFVDSLVREYLIFRGFSTTLKNFDSDLKTDKEKGFRVDKLVEHICSQISTYDLKSLCDLWENLNTRVFLNLSQVQSEYATKLEQDLYKLYLANCIHNRRQDKATEFFQTLGVQLHSQESWKEWFCNLAFHQMEVPRLMARTMEKPKTTSLNSCDYENEVSKALMKLQEPPPDVIASAEVMDDFSVIAPDLTSQSVASNSKSLKNVLKKKFARGESSKK